jgi:hypothetical protein
MPPVRLGNIQFGPSNVVGNRYSQLKKMSERIDAYLQGQGANQQGREMLEGIQVTIDSSLESLERSNPTVKKAIKASSTYFEKNLRKPTNPLVQEILNTPDDVEMGKKALSAVLTGKASDRQMMLDVFGEPLKKHVEIAAGKVALESAVDKTSGVIDPVALVAWFRDNPQIGRFVGADMKKELDGIVNLITDNAYRKGFVAPSKALKVLESPMIGRAGALEAVVSAARGSAAGGAVSALMLLMNPMAQAMGRALNSPYGKALAAAAADVRPGTPKLGRMSNLFFSKFGPAVVGNELTDVMATRPDDRVPLRQPAPGGP